MRSSTLLVYAVLLIESTLAAPSARPHVLHEKRDYHHEDWQKRDRLHATHVLPMKIGLKQRNLEHGERFLMDVSDPTSPNYGKHWTAEQVANMFMPSKETSDRVLEWLAESGIHAGRVEHSTGRNWLHFDATVDEVENLLKTEYHVYEHSSHSGQRAACDSYHVPEDVQPHIDFIMPTIQLDHPQELKRRDVPGNVDTPPNSRVPITANYAHGAPGLKNGTTTCANLATIDCLRALYQFPYVGTAHEQNILGIGEWSDYLYYPDLKPFFANYTKPIIPSDTTPIFLSIDGGKHSNLSVAMKGEVIESALDFQTAFSIIYPQKIRQYQMGDSVNVNSVGTFNIFLDALDASYCTYEGGDSKKYDPQYPDPKKGGYKGPLQCGGAPNSTVYSFSYLQEEAKLPMFYQHRQCNEWMKLGLQGTTVMFASGDSGVANRYNAGFPNKCLAPHNNTQSKDYKRFNPGFPVNCPYVTAVGATQLKSNDLSKGERAVSYPDGQFSFYSGGGFANYFPVPSYQSRQVAQFLDTYSPKYGEDIFNHSGRGFPDIASLGLNLVTVYLNQTIGVGGTSASTPTAASIITLLNEKRLAAGKSSLGFVNPVFYANPQAFNDIVVGGNPGCGSQGFNAMEGWDPVTGLGTINYPKLLDVVMKLP